MNSFLLLLLLEVIAGVNAGLLFNLIERPLAGLIAGSVFCLVGLAAVWIFYKRAVRWRGLSLLVCCVYLFAFAIPLLAVRATLPLTDNIESVLNTPIQVFHKGSELMFSLLIIFTVSQWLMTRKLPKD